MQPRRKRADPRAASPRAHSRAACVRIGRHAGRSLGHARVRADCGRRGRRRTGGRPTSRGARANQLATPFSARDCVVGRRTFARRRPHALAAARVRARTISCRHGVHRAAGVWARRRGCRHQAPRRRRVKLPARRAVSGSRPALAARSVPARIATWVPRLPSFSHEIDRSHDGQIYAREFRVNAQVAAGFAHLAVHDAAGAADAFRSALETLPRNGRALIGLYLALKQTSFAVERRLLLSRVDATVSELASGGRLGEAALVAAASQVARGDVESACATLQRLLDAAPPGQAGWIIPIDPALAPLALRRVLRKSRHNWLPARPDPSSPHNFSLDYSGHASARPKPPHQEVAA